MGVVLVQIAVIIGLIVYISYKKGNTLGVSVHPISPQSIQHTPNPEFHYFYEPKPNSKDNPNPWGPNKATYTINADALNERFNYAVQKGKGVYRIITLGDSFTYGLYVDTKDNWTELLEDKLNAQNTCNNITKFEVINLAVEGYDNAYNVERYRLRGVKYNPDLVLWLIYDPYRITEKISAIIAKNKEQWIKEGLHENSYDFWVRAYQELAKEVTLDADTAYQLKELTTFNNLYKGPLVFLYQQKGESTIPFPYIVDFAKTRKKTAVAPIVDIVDTPTLHFPDDHHPNIRGHQAIAHDVLEYLRTSRLIPCSP